MFKNEMSVKGWRVQVCVCVCVPLLRSTEILMPHSEGRTKFRLELGVGWDGQGTVW